MQQPYRLGFEKRGKEHPQYVMDDEPVNGAIYSLRCIVSVEMRPPYRDHSRRAGAPRGNHAWHCTNPNRTLYYANYTERCFYADRTGVLHTVDKRPNLTCKTLGTFLTFSMA